MSLRKGCTLTCDGIDYELQTTVGGGGSGDVWLAIANSGRWAVKLLKGVSDKKKVERFDREASFQQSCRHQHIVRVIGRGEHEGRPFYIMPSYAGTLRNVIDRGDAEATELLSYVQQVGKALQFAHAQGMVHRDVKPENVLIDGASAALADFGIAHFVDSDLTVAGELVGNRDYRAPEQRKGQDARRVGPEADVYALGLILNECFTGAMPAGPIFRSIEESHPHMSYLDSVVARMLAQDPSNRPTVADVLTEIRFSEARRSAEISDIEEFLRLEDETTPSGTERLDELFRQASEDIWYATRLLATKTPEELRQYNGNWHMRLGYNADSFLVNLCVQSRLVDLCRHKFDYESHAYSRGHIDKSLDPEGGPGRTAMYHQARALVSDHPLPPAHDLSGPILKTFSSCTDYHCEELLTDFERIVSEVAENLLDVPILWMVQYLASYVSSIKEISHLENYVSINWGRSETFGENPDDADLFTPLHPSLDPEPVLKVFRESWDVSITRIGDEWVSVLFRTRREYLRFRDHSLGRATPKSLFEDDVKDLFRGAVSAGDITHLRLSSLFDVCNTLAKILGIRNDL